MRIVAAHPPNFNELDAVFHIGTKPVIFAWGQTIFNPNGGNVSAAILAHEAVHGHQQGDDIRGWWRRYIDDPTFRLEHGIPAHRVEYLVLVHGGAKGIRSETRTAPSNGILYRRLAETTKTLTPSSLL